MQANSRTVVPGGTRKQSRKTPPDLRMEIMKIHKAAAYLMMRKIPVTREFIHVSDRIHREVAFHFHSFLDGILHSCGSIPEEHQISNLL